jgi:hypothetical protein
MRQKRNFNARVIGPSKTLFHMSVNLFSPTLFSGRVLQVLEEQKVPLLRRLPRQAQRADRRQCGTAHREEIVLNFTIVRSLWSFSKFCSAQAEINANQK